jgi:hypothetical protein
MRNQLSNQTKGVILTSHGRELELPVSLDEMKPDERVVATNVNVGLLFIREYKNGKSPALFDRDILTVNDMASQDYSVSFISLPLIDLYKAEKERLNLEKQKVESSLQENMQIVRGIEESKH